MAKKDMRKADVCDSTGGRRGGGRGGRGDRPLSGADECLPRHSAPRRGPLSQGNSTETMHMASCRPHI